MINAILRLFRGDAPQRLSRPETDNPQLPPMFPEKSIDVMIARAAERQCNRDRDLANIFIRTHTILDRGRRN